MEDKKLLANINDSLSRLALMSSGTSHEGRRDFYEIFGWSRTINVRDFRFEAERGSIASRVVCAYPEAVWANPPLIIENPDDQERNSFEASFDKLAEDLNLWHYLNRADRLAQIGRFSLLLIGIADGQTLEKPASKGLPVYLMPFGEDCVEIEEVEEDPSSPRYGKPKTYLVQVGIEGVGNGSELKTIHHSRVLHIAERTLDNDIYGKPILEPIYDILMDLKKVLGGSAEGFFFNSSSNLHVNAETGANIKDPEQTKSDLEDLQHKINRVVRTQGMDLKVLNAPMNSPKDIFNALISIIGGTTGIPQRILLGSERGELSSNQDQNAWDSRVEERRQNFVAPQILRQLLDKLEAIGAMKIPEGISWEWPNKNEISELDAAEVASKISTAVATYSNSPESEHIIPPEQFVSEVLGLEYREDEIERLIKEEEEAMNKEQEEFKKDGLDEFGQPKAPPQDNTSPLKLIEK